MTNSMQVETFIIGEREFTAKKMNVFDAGRFLLKLKDIAAPAISAIGDMEQAATIISMFSGLDEDTHEKVIFPMLAASAVYSVEDKRKITSVTDMNLCFDVDTLFDFYLLVWEVIKLNFTPFIKSVSNHFGAQMPA